MLSIKKLREKYRYSVILLRELVKTDFKLRYEGSALGMIWSTLRPLLLFSIMYVVFVHFLRFGEGVPNFAVSLLLAIVLWGFFQETASQGMMAIVARGDILRKINIPKYIVVVSASVSAFINLAINLVIVIVFALISGVQFSWLALLVIPIIIELYVFALSVALLLSSLYVKFRDLAHIWDVIMQAWYFATPIIYPLSMVAAMSPVVAKIMLFSPMAQIIQDARFVMVDQVQTTTVWSVMPNPLLVMTPIIIVAVVATISVLYFRKSSKKFTELV